MNESKYNNLVSIVVITFNSSKYVIETLESVKNQTYINIELIISDDCSTDNTREKCLEWISTNKKRFFKAELITVKTNTGIAPNCNRGLYNAQGEWIKLIAGDDILLPNCISDFMRYVEDNPLSEVIYGNIQRLEKGKLNEVPLNPALLLPAGKQFKSVLKNANFPAQGMFYKTNTLVQLGGFDEKYPFCEEFPLYLKLAKENIKFDFLNEVVSIYRLHETNISSGTKNDNFVNLKFYRSSEAVLLNELLPMVINNFMFITFFNILNYVLIFRIIILLGNKKNYISSILKLFIVHDTIKHIYIKIKNKIF